MNEGTTDGAVLLSEIQVLDPVRHGLWVNVPIEPVPLFALKGMCVMQNSLTRQGNRNGAATVRSLLLGTDDHTSVADLTGLESFLCAATRALWWVWFPGQAFALELTPQVKKHTALAPFKLEMRLYTVGREEPAICDELGAACLARDLCVGDYVDVSLRVLGMWCSSTKCGLKHRIEGITLLRSRGNAIE